jgi:hypothetical protein
VGIFKLVEAALDFLFDFLLDRVLNWPAEAQIIIFGLLLYGLIELVCWIF